MVIVATGEDSNLALSTGSEVYNVLGCHLDDTRLPRVCSESTNVLGGEAKRATSSLLPGIPSYYRKLEGNHEAKHWC